MSDISELNRMRDSLEEMKKVLKDEEKSNFKIFKFKIFIF